MRHIRIPYFIKIVKKKRVCGMKHKKWILWVLMTGMLLILTGCREAEPAGKIRDLEFTVMNNDEAPKALDDVIKENWEKEMKLSYQKDGYLYISRGFGEQKTGGYSITVEHCYLGEDGIHVKFQLIGPSHDEKLTEDPSYPYIIIKMEAMDSQIIFDN